MSPAPLSDDIKLYDRPVLDGVALTGKYLAQVVEQCCGKGKVKLLEMKIVPLTEVQGYVTTISKLTLKWPDKHPGDGLPESLILKIPAPELFEQNSATEGELTQEQQDAVLNWLITTHNNECRTYELFKRRREENSIISLLPLPVVYATREMSHRNSVPYLLMQDLTATARCADVIDGLTLKQCENAVESLASLHAFCYTDSDWNAQNTFKTPKQIDWRGLTEIFTSHLRSLFDYSPEAFASIGSTKEELLEFFDMATIFDDIFTDENAVIVHGDYRINNMLFGSMTNDARGTTDDHVAIIDWQCVYAGWCTADLGRLLISGLDWKFRRGSENHLLERYYSCLVAKLPKGMSTPYRLDEVKRLYFDRTFRFYALFFTCEASLFLKQKQRTSKYTSDEIRRYVGRVQAAMEDAAKYHYKISTKNKTQKLIWSSLKKNKKTTAEESIEKY